MKIKPRIRIRFHFGSFFEAVLLTPKPLDGEIGGYKIGGGWFFGKGIGDDTNYILNKTGGKSHSIK